jgi:hypothetical protein
MKWQSSDPALSGGRQNWRSLASCYTVFATRFDRCFFSPHSSASVAIRYRDIATRIAGFPVPILYDWRIDGVCYLLMLGLFLWALVTKSMKFDGRLSACVLLSLYCSFACRM